jgi:hypothetical protein
MPTNPPVRRMPAARARSMATVLLSIAVLPATAAAHLTADARIVTAPILIEPVAIGPVMIGPVVLETGGITLSVDPRLEVLSIVQYLAGYRPITELPSAYRARVDSAFAEFREHAAVSLLRDMAASGFSFHVPPQATLHRTLDLQPARPFPESVTARGGGAARLDAFYHQLAGFSRASRFDAFFLANLDFYRSLLNQAAAHVGPLQSPNLLEAYYGERMAAYNIVLVPLYMPGGFGIELSEADGTRAIFSVQGPLATAGESLNFGDEQSFTYLVWHEFSHSFVNPLTRLHLEHVQRHAALYEPIADVMRRQAYGNWESTVNEHIVRAVTTRLAYLHHGPDAGERALHGEQQRGFSYVTALCAALERYEADRDTWPTLRDFYPELVAALAELAPPPPPRQGTTSTAERDR